MLPGPCSELEAGQVAGGPPPLAEDLFRAGWPTVKWAVNMLMGSVCVHSPAGEGPQGLEGLEI